MTSRAVFAVCSVVCATAFGCRDNGNAAGSEPPRIEVKASVTPVDAVTVAAPIDGRVTHVAVTEGATVHKGDVLLTLDNPAVDRDVAYANAAATAAARRHTPPPHADHADNKAAEKILRNKEAKLERYKRLLATGDVSQQEVQDVETEVATARERLAAPPTPATDTAVAQAELDRADADRKYAEYRKSLLTVIAPATGVAHLRVHEGDDVFPRDALVDVRDTSTVRVQAQVAPELLRFVRPGLPVDVKVMTIPPHNFREPIVSVSEPGADGGAAITVTVPNSDRMMQPGTPAVITVQ